MARTIRRGNEKHMYLLISEREFQEQWDRIVSEAAEPGKFLYMIKWYMRWMYGCCEYTQYVAKRKAHIHSDNNQTHYTPPSSHVNLCHNRPLRYKHKQQIQYALETDDFDQLLLEPFIKDAGWYYW